MASPFMVVATHGHPGYAEPPDHVTTKEGAIQFPVFHRNHPCLRFKSDQKKGETSAVEVIEDSKINSFAFLMPIKLGTPPLMNLVAFDTGATLSWVQCQPCEPKCHKQDPEAGHIFDPSNSTTFRHATCKSSECSSIKYGLRLYFANCMEKEDTCLYSMTYGGGWAYTAGKLVWDKVVIGNEQQDTTISFSLLFGCSLDVQYSDYEAGIIGFGTSNYSFEQVAKIISYKAFSYCLPSNESVKGYLNLGDYRRQGVDSYTPLFRSSSTATYSLLLVRLVANGQNIVTTPSQMVVDSGAKPTILNSDTFARLDKVITQAIIPLNYSRGSTRGQSICFESRAYHLGFTNKHPVFTDWSALPIVELAFGGRAATLTLPPNNVFYNDPDNGLCMNFQKSRNINFQILGNRVMRSFETIFDIQGKRFGFSYAAC